MKRALQITLAILSLIPAYYGVRNTLTGAVQFMPAEQVTAAIDSQFRFQSGWYVGLALLLWWIIPQIERQTMAFRIMALAIFLGGLGRLLSYTTLGPAPGSAFPAMIFELSMPLFVDLAGDGGAAGSWLALVPDAQFGSIVHESHCACRTSCSLDGEVDHRVGVFFASMKFDDHVAQRARPTQQVVRTTSARG